VSWTSQGSHSSSPILRHGVRRAFWDHEPKAATLPGGVKLPGLAHHLIDLGDMLLLESDLFPGVFF